MRPIERKEITVKLFLKTFRLLGAVTLASLGGGLPATAAEPEVELHCEIRPTRAAAARANAARIHAANARLLRAEIATEATNVQAVAPEALAARLTFSPLPEPPR